MKAGVAREAADGQRGRVWVWCKVKVGRDLSLGLGSWRLNCSAGPEPAGGRGGERLPEA